MSCVLVVLVPRHGVTASAHSLWLCYMLHVCDRHWQRIANHDASLLAELAVGRHACEMGDVGQGDVVAIWGCGAPALPLLGLRVQGQGDGRRGPGQPGCHLGLPVFSPCARTEQKEFSHNTGSISSVMTVGTSWQRVFAVSAVSYMP